LSKEGVRLFYLRLEGGLFFPRVSPFGYTDPKQDMSQGAEELGCPGTRAHMNYKVHNTCHHEFGGIPIILSF
jgi:hypothetical protein